MFYPVFQIVDAVTGERDVYTGHFTLEMVAGGLQLDDMKSCDRDDNMYVVVVVVVLPLLLLFFFFFWRGGREKSVFRPLGSAGNGVYRNGSGLR